MAPLSAESFAVHLAIGKSTRDKLCYAQELLSHTIPSGDLAQVLDRVLDLAIGQLEKRKFAATDQPRPASRRSLTTNKRHIPAHVKRAVWERDQGRCTFTSKTGRRCGERKFLEYDHMDPVARGGEATVQGIRLRCRAHNQYEAMRTFGAGFMAEQREAVRRRARGSPHKQGFSADAARRG